MSLGGDQNPPDDLPPQVETGMIVFPVSDGIPKADQQINELQEQIQDGKDRYLELGFVFILFAIVVLDYFLFRELDTAIGIAFICFIELIALLVLCKRFGIEEPYVFIVAMLKRITASFGKPEN